jgi:hypothetical protein
MTSDDKNPIAKRLRNNHSDDHLIFSLSVPVTSDEETLSQAKNSTEWNHLWKPAIDKEMKNLDDNGTGK